MSKSGHFTAIRGIAAWWVVAYHFRESLPATTPSPILEFLQNGYFAVDLFFILSGFVLTLNYGDWFINGIPSRERYVSFLKLRLSRIYPLHFMMLAIFITIPIAISLFASHKSEGDFPILYYILSIFLMQGWNFTKGLAWNVPAWSISAEWLGYLGFPLLVAFILPILRTSVRALISVIALLMALAWASRANFSEQAFGLIRCLLEIAVGLAICRLASDGTPFKRNLSLSATALGWALSVALGIPGYFVFHCVLQA